MRFSIISRSGLVWLSLWLLAALFLLLQSHWLYSVPFWLLALLTSYLYRDLPRSIPAKPLAILSPLDGRLLSSHSGHDPYVEREALCLELRTHHWGPFVLRSPMEGKVVKQWFSPAGRDAAGRRIAAVLAMWIRNDEDDDVVVVLTPRYRWIHIHCMARAGERVGQGRRCGFIPLGARIEVFLPETARLKLEAGQDVRAGDSILAELVHK